ncbi:MAG: T9SS type A sorting domain-containing protein [Bacteroidales bacterium]|nr:T9SS type A sorting domain-containing protein [Bacteroidales bacterium]
MKRVFTAIILCLLPAAFLCAQSVTLTFTGSTVNNLYVPLNRVVVSNLTKGWQETLMWPDTVLVMNITGIHDVETGRAPSLQLSQNTPNPFNGTTLANLLVTEPGDVTVTVTDITGRTVETMCTPSLQPGVYQMRVSLSLAGTYFLTAQQNGHTASVKMVNNGEGGANNVTVNGMLDMVETPLFYSKPAPRGTTNNPFDPGDQMEYIGFAMLHGMEVESGHITQEADASQTVALLFPNTQPCPDAPTVTDVQGNVYNTVQIGSQCWMRENLRATMFADSTPITPGASYSTPEPNYFDDSTSIIPLEQRGYLYDWAAAMHEAPSSYTAPSGVQGVCPNGWHLPSTAEWGVLLSFIRDQAEYNCNGEPTSTAKALASPSWWNSFNTDCCPGNQSVFPNNASGFGAVPAGTLRAYGYDDVGHYALLWTSSENESYSEAAYYYGLDYDSQDVARGSTAKDRRGSVRCLRD